MTDTCYNTSPSLHVALPILLELPPDHLGVRQAEHRREADPLLGLQLRSEVSRERLPEPRLLEAPRQPGAAHVGRAVRARRDRTSTRLNSSHLVISYAVFCLK